MIARSWVESANDPEGDFPLANLPCGVTADGRCVVAIGTSALDVTGLETGGLIALPGGRQLSGGAWNDHMAAGPVAWAALRARLTALLAHGSPERAAVERHLLTPDALALPLRVAEFTDFYAGRHHAENIGAMLRGPDRALPENWLHLPVGYNGRASTVVVSGTPVRRPSGQIRPDPAAPPILAPTRKLDFELELGAVVGLPTRMGHPVTVAEAQELIFGHVLLNDWSARDIQAWEYQPLGPFQSKAFATTISPWIVTTAALAPVRRPAPPRDVPLLPHLAEAGPGHLDIDLTVTLTADGGAESVLTRTSSRELTWSFAQMLAHHASSGCAMRTGDLLGSGTISGPSRDACGSLMEITRNGAEPLHLPNGTTRAFLADGDRVTLRGHAQAQGWRVGFGACVGQVVPGAYPPPPCDNCL